MGRKDDRATRELDRDQLAKLTRQATGEQAVVQAPQDDTPSSPRTQTLQDPMTAALLAEVARSSRTRDFEPGDVPYEIEGSDDDEDTNPGPPLPHPVLKRR